jgi:hypothetical protein
MMQLAWPQEAYTIAEVVDSSVKPLSSSAVGDLPSSESSPLGSPIRYKERQLLPSSVLDYLNGHGAKYVLYVF